MENGKSEKLKSLGKRVNNSVSTALSSIFLSLGCAFVSSYNHSTFWDKVTFDLLLPFNFIAYILTNPYIYIFFGALIFILSEYGNHIKKDEISDKNAELININRVSQQKAQELEAENVQLKGKINSEQEMSRELRGKICDVHIKQVTTWLKGVYKQMNFTPQERVSIYFEVNHEFHILDRYSSNPSFKEIHKQRFSLNQGVISKAWQNGVWHEVNSPSYTTENDDFVSYMMRVYEFNENEISALNMKSCRLLGVAITEADENIGVILFESTSERALSGSSADAILEYCKNYQSHLCGFVKDSIMYSDEFEISKIASKSDTDKEVLQVLGGSNEK